MVAGARTRRRRAGDGGTVGADGCPPASGLNRPYLGGERRTLPGSVAELTTVNTGGHDLGLMIRGTSTENPVLLFFLAGGPGGSELGAMRRHLPALEESFTVATWTSGGRGTFYDELDPTQTVSLEGYVSDTIAGDRLPA